jgi:hypothetical protein
MAIAFTAAQIMLIDLLTDRIVTLATGIARAKQMSDEEVEKEIALWETESDKQMERLKQH